MRLSVRILGILPLALISACSGNDEPEYPVFMQPSSIIAEDADGGNQVFAYDGYGKIREWSLRFDDNESVKVRYSYPDENTINIKSEEVAYYTRTLWEERIELINGRASKSEGTFTRWQNGNILIQKTYRLEFEYDPANHLTAVKHSELMGIDDFSDADWNESWTWENYLIWESGNLVEFENFNGNSTVFQSTKYAYSGETAAYPVIIPTVVNSLHHNPLFMQGVFGLNSKNLLESASDLDEKGSLGISRHYVYEIENDLISNYTETTTFNTAFSRSISYRVNWTKN